MKRSAVLITGARRNESQRWHPSQASARSLARKRIPLSINGSVGTAAQRRGLTVSPLRREAAAVTHAYSLWRVVPGSPIHARARSRDDLASERARAGEKWSGSLEPFCAAARPAALCIA